MSHQPKNIVITGGSRGLGRSLALELDRLGHRVCIIGRTEESLTQVASLGRRIEYLVADVSQKDVIYPLAGRIGAMFDGIDIVIQCASYLGPTPLRLLLDSDCEDLEQVLQTNLLAPFRLTKALFPHVAQRRGIFINLSSDAALNSYPTWGAYSSSKAALDRLSGILDEETKSAGVRHLALDPGDMATDMHFAAIPDADPALLHRPEEVARDMTRLLLSGSLPEQSRCSADEWRKYLAAQSEDKEGGRHESAISI